MIGAIAGDIIGSVFEWNKGSASHSTIDIFSADWEDKEGNKKGMELYRTRFGPG